MLIDNIEIESKKIPVVDSPLSDKNLYPSKNLLIVYNIENMESVILKDYYIANRPGFKSANVFGVRYALPRECQETDCLDKTGEFIYKKTFKNSIRNPIVAWIKAHPEKKIRHIVLMRGLPSKLVAANIQEDVWGSIQWALAKSPVNMVNCADYDYINYSTGLPYANDEDKKCDNPPSPVMARGTSFFQPQSFPGTLALVTSLDMGSVEATKAYIDKLKSMHGRMSRPSLIISATDANKGGKNYYFEDSKAKYPGESHNASFARKEGVLAKNKDAQVFYRSPEQSHFSQAHDVLGYTTWGQNSDWGGQYMLDGSIRFSGNSGWYIIDTFESFNGTWTYGAVAGEHFQGNFIKWFSRKAFGGNNYENTPVAAVTTVEEPSLVGKNKPELFSCWDAGNLFIDCAWSTARSPYFQAVGDPWVTI